MMGSLTVQEGVMKTGSGGQCREQETGCESERELERSQEGSEITCTKYNQDKIDQWHWEFKTIMDKQKISWKMGNKKIQLYHKQDSFVWN